MGAGPSGFRTEAARAEYHRLYDEAIACSPVQVEESDVETSFGTTHVLTAGDRTKPPLVALHGLSISSTTWLPLLQALTETHHVRMLDRGDSTRAARRQSCKPVAGGRLARRPSTHSRSGAPHSSASPSGRCRRLRDGPAAPRRAVALLALVGIVSLQHPKWLAAMTFNLASGRRSRGPHAPSRSS